MRFPKSVSFLLVCTVAFVAVSESSQAAHVQDRFLITKSYKVQVEYWFFDTDYFRWSTVLETTSREEAEMVYELLVYAKEQNQLNRFAPSSYWRFIAVDVRMITVYEYPRFTYTPDVSMSQHRFDY